MDDITASIIVACQTSGAVQSINKLGFSLSLLTKKAFQFGLDSLNAFRQTQDASWKFSKTFANSLGSADKAVKTFMEDYNLAEVTAKSMLTDTAQVLKGMGFAEKEALKVSESVSRWGIDLASFTGYAGGAEGAVQAITAAMLGENERLKALGIVIREDSDEFRNLVKQMQEEKGVTEQRARVYAKFALIKKQAKDAEGDYKAEGENWTQNIKLMDQAIIQVKSNLGEMLYELTSINDLTGAAGGGAMKFAKEWHQKSADINHELRVMVLNVKTFFKLVGDTLEPFIQIYANHIANAMALGEWLYENWGKIISGLGDLFTAFFKELWNKFKQVSTWQISLAKMIAAGVKAALKGEEIGKAVMDSFVADFKSTGEIEKAFKKMNLGKANFVNPFDVDFDFMKRWNKTLDEHNRDIRNSEARRDKQKAALKDKDTGGAGTTDTGKETLPLGNMLKDLFKYRTTVQSGVVADSTEGVRLSNRRFFFNSPGDPAKQSADHLKKIEDQNKTIVNVVQSLNSLVSGINSGGIKIAAASGGGIAGFKKH